MQSKKWRLSHKFFYLLFAVTQSFLLDFSCSSDNITGSNTKSTSKKGPTSVFEITMQYLLKNIKIYLLCQCGLFNIHVCPEIQLCLKMWFSTLFHITWYAEAAINVKKICFLLFFSFLVKFTELHWEVIDSNWQSVKNSWISKNFN